MKYELRMFAGRRWMETRSRPGKLNNAERAVAIDWAAEETSRLYRASELTRAVLWFRPAVGQSKEIWNLIDFIKVVGRVCTCSKQLREIGTHSSDCPSLGLLAHEIWSKR